MSMRIAYDVPDARTAERHDPQFSRADYEARPESLKAHLTYRVVALTGAGWIWTGRLLGAGERRGALTAAVTLLTPVLMRVAGQAMPTSEFVIGVVGTIAVLSAWRDLR